jgi:predicted nuclease of restriction endonuclease-like RecB superfamily
MTKSERKKKKTKTIVVHNPTMTKEEQKVYANDFSFLKNNKRTVESVANWRD